MTISANELWNRVLERLKQQLSRPTFETWIQTATVQNFQDNCLVIQTPNAFVRNHLQKHYVKTIAQTLEEIVGQAVEIQLTVTQGENLSFLGGQELNYLAEESQLN